jgi:hypothetical protein
MQPLTVLKVKALKDAGTWWVSRNLYLQIPEGGSRSWLFRYMFNGRSREMGPAPASS